VREAQVCDLHGAQVDGQVYRFKFRCQRKKSKDCRTTFRPDLGPPSIVLATAISSVIRTVFRPNKPTLTDPKAPRDSWPPGFGKPPSRGSLRPKSQATPIQVRSTTPSSIARLANRS